jgi:hypothetical protein
MSQFLIFGVHWSHGGETYYDELSAGSKEEAVNYFSQHKRSDVTLVEVELIGPEDMPIEQLLSRGARILTAWWKRESGPAS